MFVDEVLEFVSRVRRRLNEAERNADQMQARRLVVLIRTPRRLLKFFPAQCLVERSKPRSYSCRHQTSPCCSAQRPVRWLCGFRRRLHGRDPAICELLCDVLAPLHSLQRLSVTHPGFEKIPTFDLSPRTNTSLKSLSPRFTMTMNTSPASSKNARLLRVLD